MALFGGRQTAPMRAALYFNNRRRDRFLPPIPQEEEWLLGRWYKIGDLVTYSETLYRCVQNHQAAIGRTPDVANTSQDPVVAAVLWAEVVE